MPMVIVSQTELRTVTLKRLSICPCGYGLLRDEIPLGTEYQIDPSIEADCEFTCGGCGRHQHLPSVYTAPGGFFPKIIFEEDNSTALSA
jgi:hypothetical protein